MKPLLPLLLLPLLLIAGAASAADNLPIGKNCPDGVEGNIEIDENGLRYFEITCGVGQEGWQCSGDGVRYTTGAQCFFEEDGGGVYDLQYTVIGKGRVVFSMGKGYDIVWACS